MPSRELVRLCDAALDAGGALITLVREKPPGPRVTVAVDGDTEEMWLMQLCEGGRAGSSP
jgi:hypothetical protein